jgi:hypothetical protein
MKRYHPLSQVIHYDTYCTIVPTTAMLKMIYIIHGGYLRKTFGTDSTFEVYFFACWDSVITYSHWYVTCWGWVIWEYNLAEINTEIIIIVKCVYDADKQCNEPEPHSKRVINCLWIYRVWFCSCTIYSIRYVMGKWSNMNNIASFQYFIIGNMMCTMKNTPLSKAIHMILCV